MDSARPLTRISPSVGPLRTCKRPDIGECQDIVPGPDGGRLCGLARRFNCADPDWSDVPRRETKPIKKGR